MRRDERYRQRGRGVIAGLLPVLLAAGVTSVHGSTDGGAAAPGLTRITVAVDQPYYTLPRWCVGVKMTRYCSDYAGGRYPSDARRAGRTTPDGKRWLRCIRDMGLGFIGASMTGQGRPPNKGKPDPNYDDWRVAAEAVAGGGGVMIEYLVLVRAVPQCRSALRRLGDQSPAALLRPVQAALPARDYLWWLLRRPGR